MTYPVYVFVLLLYFVPSLAQPLHAQSGPVEPAAAPAVDKQEPTVTLGVVYKLDVLASRGGADDASGAMGNLDLMLHADLDALWGLKNSVAYLQVINDHGSKLNGGHAGSLMGISNVEVPTNTTKIFHAWLQRSYLDDSVSLLAGLYPIDSEFSVMESAGVFVHPALGPPADLALTRGPSIFNTSALGVRLRWDDGERDRYAMAALLDGIPGDPDNPHGTHVRFDSGDGAFFIAEIGYTPPERGHVFEPTDPSSPVLRDEDIRLHEKYESFGKYALGLWTYSEKVEDLVDVDGAGNPVRRPSRGGYLMAEKTLYRQAGSPVRQAAGFARASFTDGDSTPIRYALNLGLRMHAPFAGREDDIAGIAYSLGQIGRKYRQARDALGEATASAESALEITYRFRFNGWLAVQPLFQYIRHPGGDPDLSDIRVLGMRMELNPG